MGDIALARHTGVALGGSRRIRGKIRAACWRFGHLCAVEKLTLFSGGAYGVDQVSETENLIAGGENVTILADGLLRNRLLRRRKSALEGGRQLFISLYHPISHFTRYNALYRNHMIYCMGEIAVTMAAQDGFGGGWAAARDNLRAGWSPQYVYAPDPCPPGNARLIHMNSRKFDEKSLFSGSFRLREYLRETPGAPPLDPA